MQLEHDIDALGHPVGAFVGEYAAPPLPDRTRSLHGVSVRLDPLRVQHAAALWDAFFADVEGHMWTYLHAGPFSDETEFTAFLEQLCGLESLFLYAVIDTSNELPVGFASYLRADPGAGSIEVGWVTFSPRLQRTTLATDAMFAMMREAFALGYRRYEWKCNALNAPSIAAAHRLGFSFEGVFRNALTVKQRNRDTAWFAIVDHDWSRLEAAIGGWLSADNFEADGTQRTRLSDLTAPVVASRWPVLQVEL